MCRRQPSCLGWLSGFSLRAALGPDDGAKHQEAAGLARGPSCVVSVAGSSQRSEQKGGRSDKEGSKAILAGHECAAGLGASGQESQVSVWVRKLGVMLPRLGSAFTN